MYLSAFMLNFRCSSWGSASKFSMLFFVLFHDQSRCLSFNIDTLSRISLWHIKGMLILNQTYWSIAGIPLIGLSRVTCRKRNRCECDQNHHQTIEYRRKGVRFSLQTKCFQFLPVGVLNSCCQATYYHAWLGFVGSSLFRGRYRLEDLLEGHHWHQPQPGPD